MNIHTFSHINLQTLDQAVDLVRVNKLADGSREAAFVRAYPALMEAARATQRVEDAFLLTATFAHGWMPVSLRLDPRHLDAAVRAFGLARSAKAEFSLPGVDAIAACLQSLVAASKVLHFAAPAVYPTWDARIERFRRGQAPSDYPDFAQFLVNAGIDSISLNPDSVNTVRQSLAQNARHTKKADDLT